MRPPRPCGGNCKNDDAWQYVVWNYLILVILCVLQHSTGWQARAPFDAIIVTAAPPEIPTALMTQLDEGGILVLPVGDEHQYLKRVRRRGGEFIIDTVEAVRFVPLVKGELA